MTLAACRGLTAPPASLGSGETRGSKLDASRHVLWSEVLKALARTRVHSMNGDQVRPSGGRENTPPNIPLQYARKPAARAIALKRRIYPLFTSAMVLSILAMWGRSYFAQDTISYFKVSGNFTDVSSNSGAIYLFLWHVNRPEVLNDHFRYFGAPPDYPEDGCEIAKTRFIPFKAFGIGSGWRNGLWLNRTYFVVSYWVLLVPFVLPAAVQALKRRRSAPMKRVGPPV